jgi:PAS domain S-box-containing protein
MNSFRFFSFCFLQLLWLSATAQKQNIKFEHLGTGQGLSQSNVICILQDSRGFMWFGTRDGLNKYDGYNFTVYKNEPDNPSSLSNNFIRAIKELKNGDLWIATLDGLCRYDRNKNRFTTYKHDPNNGRTISHNQLTSLLEDSDGNLWVGTENGLNKFDEKNDRFVRFFYNSNDKNSLSDNFVRTIYEDKQHNLWIGTLKGGLNLYNKSNNTFTSFRHIEQDKRSLGYNNIYTLFEDSKNRLWVGTNGGGLDLFDRGSGTFSHYQHDDKNAYSLSGNNVYAINEDTDQNLWVGTENKGLNIFNPEKGIFNIYINDEVDNTGLGSNSIYSIYRDTKNNMWLGTFSGGVDLVDPDAQKFSHFRHMASKNSLSHNNVLSIIEDSEKKIWIGTDGGGLNLFDPITENFTHFRYLKDNKNSICGDYVLSICEDSKGNIWIGTWGDGITVFNRKQNSYRHYKNNPRDSTSLGSNNAWKIFEDKDKNIWIGTHGGGLNLFNPLTGTFTRYQHLDRNTRTISSNFVQSIFEDSEGKLWISTDEGLHQFDRKREIFLHYFHDERKNSIASNHVGNIYEDRNGNLWIGTRGGLSCFNKEKSRFTNYTTQDGLPGNVILGILEDGKGNLWISTNKGISRFDRFSKIFKNFSVSDGLQANEFKQHAYCRTATGTMYFGGINGFNRFLPGQIRDNSFTPPLVITGFQVFNQEVVVSDDPAISPLQKDITETKKISLPYSSSVISFEFASLNYTSIDKKQYEYMLEGFDKKWNNVGTRRAATYTNLDPGTYTFRVKGLNNDGTWSETTASLRLTILPPFWMTGWFRLLVIALVIGSALAFYRIRMKTIIRQKAILERQVKERTNRIMQQKEELRKNVEELAVVKEKLEKEKYFLDSFMDYMPDAIYFKDTESRLMRVSRYMVNKYLDDPTATVDDLIGKTDFDFQDAYHATVAYEDEQEIQQTRKPKVDYIEKETRDDGAIRWVATTKLPLINPQGTVVGTFGISKDITGIKELEHQRHQAELDKAVAQGKFEIASDFMHDIGNAVVGFGSYLTRIRSLQSEESADNLKNLSAFFEKQKSPIAAAIGEIKTDALIKMLSSMSQSQRTKQEEINRSITEQLNTITNIQEILNIQRQYITGHESQERKPVNIQNIINDSLAMLFTSLDKMAIGISLNIPTDLPILKGDRTKLMQVVLNILRNSIEAIDSNSTGKNIHLTASVCSNKLTLQIKDTGCGFNEETAHQLFNRGFTSKLTARGLGLYSSRTIVESHDGTIHMSSLGLGKGATTTLEFNL